MENQGTYPNSEAQAEEFGRLTHVPRKYQICSTLWVLTVGGWSSILTLAALYYEGLWIWKYANKVPPPPPQVRPPFYHPPAPISNPVTPPRSSVPTQEQLQRMLRAKPMLARPVPVSRARVTFEEGAAPVLPPPPIPEEDDDVALA